MTVEDITPNWEIRVIQPAEAAAILARRVPGRDLPKPPPADVAAYAALIRNGSWVLNGDPLVFDADGVLADGRTRLTACVKADHEFPTFVVRGISPDACHTLDTHRKRRITDILHIRGEEDAADLAATVSTIDQLARGVRLKGSERLDPVAVGAFLAREPGVRTAIAAAAPLKEKYVRSTIFAAGMFLTSKVDPVLSREFFDGLLHDDGTGTDRRGYAMLAKRIRGLKEDGTPSIKLRQHLQSYMAKAWSAFLDDVDNANLKFSASESVIRIRGVDPVRHAVGSTPVRPAFLVRKEYRTAVATTGVSMSIETLTPAAAERLLADNGPLVNGMQRNRKQSRLVVNQYAKDIAAGRWELNGQSIKISRDGRLLDGQHRAKACVQSGIPIRTMIVRGLPDEAFHTFDTHSKKQFSRTARRQGHLHAGPLQAALRLVWLFENHGLLSSDTPTHSEYQATLDRHGSAIAGSVAYSQSSKVRSLMTGGPAAAMHFILSSLDPVRASVFFDQFASGENLASGSPVLALRDRLMEEGRSTRRALAERQAIVYLTRAWDAFASGSSMKIVRKDAKASAYWTVPHPLGPSASPPSGASEIVGRDPPQTPEREAVPAARPEEPSHGSGPRGRLSGFLRRLVAATLGTDGRPPRIR